jgi:hypothetical protein
MLACAGRSTRAAISECGKVRQVATHEMAWPFVSGWGPLVRGPTSGAGLRITALPVGVGVITESTTEIRPGTLGLVVD